MTTPRRSAAITEGPSRAPARAMFKAVGFTDDDLRRPIIGVANTWTEIGPCTAYDQTVAVPGLSAGSGNVTADKLNQELQTATDYIGHVISHTLFANLYWDVRTRSRFTPSVGVGVGIGSTAVAYGSLWSRNANPTAITGAGA